MDVRMPDGTLIRNVPEGTTKSELQRRLGKVQTQNTPERPTGAPGQAEARPGRLPLGQGASPATGEPGGPPLVAPDRSTWDVLTGADGGERYQTWPERAVRGIFEEGKSAATLPGDVYAGKVDPRSPEGMRRATGAAMLATPVNPAVRAGAKAIPGVAKNLQKQATKAPTREELKDIAKIQLDEFKDSGLELPAKDIQNWSQGVMHELHQQGMGGQVAKKANKILKQLQKPPKDSFTTASDLHALRRTLDNVKGDPTEVAAASAVRQRLDDFIEEIGSEGAMADPVAAFKKGRGNYAASMRSKKLGGAEEKATRQAKRVNSGGNLDNTLRGKVGKIVEDASEGRTRGFTQKEINELDKVSRGTLPANAARFTGNLLGGGGGLGMGFTGAVGVGGGFMAGGLPGAAAGLAAPALGYGAKKLGGTLTRRGLRKVDESTRRRSPLAEERAAAAPMEAGPTMGAGNTVRALLMSGMLAPQGLPMVDQAQAGEVTGGLPYADQQLPAPQQQPPPAADAPAQQQPPTPPPAAAPEEKPVILPPAQRRQKVLDELAQEVPSLPPEQQEAYRKAITKVITNNINALMGSREELDAYIREVFGPENMPKLYAIYGPAYAEGLKEAVLVLTLRPAG